MIIFKESTHSLLDNFHNPLAGKEDVALGIIGSMGLRNLIEKSLNTKNLEEVYKNLPDPIRKKIESGVNLTPAEERQEIQVAQETCNIRFRPGIQGHNALQSLNEYYRENNPVSSIRHE